MQTPTIPMHQNKNNTIFIKKLQSYVCKTWPKLPRVCSWGWGIFGKRIFAVVDGG